MVQPTADEISHPLGAGVTTQLKDIRKTLPFRVLSEADWTHWTTKGYVIVRGAVPPENVRRLADLLWDFDEKDPADPSTWYAPERRAHARADLNNAGMVEIYNHQYLWDNRQEPRVYDAFVDIWDREDLWVAIDRANLNVPRQDKSGSRDGFIHWDVNTSLDPKPIGVQGVLSLMPQDEETGGFQCVPYLFHHFDDWVRTQPADRNPLLPDMTGLARENITMAPGDLLIFDGQQVPQPPANNEELEWWVGREGVPSHWDLLNQNWTVQLMPAQGRTLPEILQTQPQVAGFPGDQFQLPQFNGLTSSDLNRVNAH